MTLYAMGASAPSSKRENWRSNGTNSGKTRRRTWSSTPRVAFVDKQLKSEEVSHDFILSFKNLNCLST